MEKAAAGLILLLSAGFAGAQFPDWSELVASDWQYHRVVPKEIDSDLWESLTTSSWDELETPDSSTKLELRVYCDGPNVALWGESIHGLFFAHDGEDKQDVQYRFDNKERQSGTWIISRRETAAGDIEGLFVPPGERARFVREMTKSRFLRMEIQPLGGEEQVIRFGVGGLEASLEGCL